MARIRSIKIGFFQNDVLASLPALDRLLFAGLWVIADREGRLEDRPLRIRGELFPYEPEVDCDAALDRLQAAGFIRRYRAGAVDAIQIESFLAHQKPHQREAESRIPAQAVAEHDLGRARPCLGDAEPGGLGVGLGCGLGLGGKDLDPDQARVARRFPQPVENFALMLKLVHRLVDDGVPEHARKDALKDACAQSEIVYDADLITRALNSVEARRLAVRA